MNDIQHQFVKKILADAPKAPQDKGVAFAPSNIALCKYWGKRNADLNLPVNSSLSVSLGALGTHTSIQIATEGHDSIFLNGKKQSSANGFFKRLSGFLDLFRTSFGGGGFVVRTKNSIPTAAGLASSASGFAALVLALNELGGWMLPIQKLSMLARLGSGSASRSLWNGFVQWHAGVQDDGMDSFAEPLLDQWPGFRIGVVELSSAEKPVGSREGMNRTTQTSVLYQNWPHQVDRDLQQIREAIASKDFEQLGRTAETNALSMHATMFSAWPPLIYMQPETLHQMHRIHQLRAEGLEVYLTMDAGPNLKLLFLESSIHAIRSAFPSVEIIAPFGADYA